MQILCIINSLFINHEQLHVSSNVDISYSVSHIFQHVVVLTELSSEDYRCQGSGVSQQYPCTCTEHSSVLCGSYIIADASYYGMQ